MKPMKARYRDLISASLGLLVLALLVWLTFAIPLETTALLEAISFVALIVFAAIFDIPLVRGSVSLMPMMAVATYLALGLVPAGWATFVGAGASGLVRHFWPEEPAKRQRPERLEFLSLIAADAATHSASLLAGAAVFEFLGGTTPLTTVDAFHLLPLLLLFVTYVGVNYLVSGVFLAVRGRESAQDRLRSLPGLFLHGGGPLALAPLVALIYTRLGPVPFALFALALVLSLLLVRSLALADRRLEQRVQELGNLQAVGRALSTSLHTDTVLSTIHEQVARFMPVHDFYIALSDPETDEIRFPLVVEGGTRIEGQWRRASDGLLQYVLETRKSLLIRQDVPDALLELGLESVEHPPACWLGAPMLVRNQPLGVIALQSYSTAGVYDHSHQELLVAIADQAAGAIQNARRYARTDATLVRRVEELHSIFRATHEGLLFLDLDLHVLAVNRALADLIGVTQKELAGQSLVHPRPGEDRRPVELIGYSLQDLQADCEGLAVGEQASKQVVIAIGEPKRHIERTLTPVRDRQGEITGWLVVFRDMTGEVELARMKEDLTQLLAHDLRSPLTVLSSGLDLLDAAFADQRQEDFDQLMAMTRRSSQRILGMVNELLDISKLESDQLILYRETVDVKPLLKELVAAFAPLATRNGITLEIAVDPDLPPLYVDPQIIDRVLRNLLDNALKFTPTGGRVRLWARLPGLQLEVLFVGVSDTGPGIPAEEQPLLFERFQQMPSVQDRRTGTGLGLPFCKLAVEAHDGEIWMESEEGKGSTFIMMLPVTR